MVWARAERNLYKRTTHTNAGQKHAYTDTNADSTVSKIFRQEL
jgi:hypothetical protein